MAGQQRGDVDLSVDPIDQEIDSAIDAAIATRTAKRERKNQRDVRNAAGEAAAGIPYAGDIFGAAQSALRGMAQGAASTRIGFNELIGDKAKANELREDRKAIDEFGGPSLSAIDTGANVGGRLAYEVGEFAAPGAILGKAAKIAKLPKLAALLHPASTVGKIAAGTVLNAPLNVTKSADRDNSTAGALADATGNETLEKIASTRTGRGLLEVGVDALGNTVAEGAIKGYRGLKGARLASKRAALSAERAAARSAGAAVVEGAAGSIDDEIEAAIAAQSPKGASLAEEASGALSTSPTETLDADQAPLRNSSVQSRVPSETSRVGSPSSSTTRTDRMALGDAPAAAIPAPVEVGTVDPASGKKILQPSSDLKHLLGLAAETRPLLEQHLTEAAEGIPGVKVFGVRAKHLGADGLENPLGLARLEQKIADRAGSAHVVSDYVGGRVWVDDAAHAHDVVQQLEGKGWKILDDEDFLAGQGKDRLGYKARHLQMQAPNGMSVELQIQPRHVGEVQEAAHVPLNVLRSNEAPTALREQLAERVRQTFAMGEQAPAHAPITLEQQIQEVGPLPKPTGDHEADAKAALAYVDKFEEWYRGKAGVGIPGPVGRGEAVRFPGGRELPARYRVVDASSLQPSHDPFSFQPNPAYPEGVQGRAYHGPQGKAARDQVELNTPKLREREILDAGSAVEAGPPVIAQDGTVIAGNQRSMLVTRAHASAPERSAAYKAELKRRAAVFGLDPAQVDAVKSPVLVREITDPAVHKGNPQLLGELNRLSDTPAMKAKEVVSEGASRAAQLEQGGQALSHYASTFDGSTTLRGYLDTKAGGEFVKLLQADGVIQPQEVARYVDVQTNALTRPGKLLVEDMMYAAAIGSPDVVARAPAQALEKLEHAIPAMVKARAAAGWDLDEPLREAFDLIQAKRKADVKSIDAIVQQGDLLGRTWSDNGVQLARLLDGDSKKAITDTFRRYAEAATESAKLAGGADLFGNAETAATAGDRLLGKTPAAAAPAAAPAAYAPEPWSHRGSWTTEQLARARRGNVGGSGADGVRMMGSIAGAGIGGLAAARAGAQQGGDQKERRDRALAWALVGATAGAGLPWADRSLAAMLHAARPARDVVAGAIDKHIFQPLEGLDHYEDLQLHPTPPGARTRYGAIGKLPDDVTIKAEPLLESSPSDHRIVARDSKGRDIGSVEYSLGADKVWIDNVTVIPARRRQGIAAGLYDKILEAHPGMKIGTAEQSADGEAFRAAYDQARPRRTGAIGVQPTPAAAARRTMPSPAAVTANPNAPTLVDKALTLWKAGMLTAPPTHIANTIGNVSMAALESAKEAPAAAFDAMLSIVTGARTKAAPGLGTVAASFRGAMQGARDAVDVLKHGQTASTLQKLGMHREIDFKSPILDVYTKTVFRALGAADQVFRGMALHRSIENQARVLAKAEGHRGAARAARVSALISAPTPAMSVQAIADAELATFQNNGHLAKLARSVKKPMGPIGDVLIPFSQTPANVASRVAEYSPLGAAAAAAEILQAAMTGKGVDKALQRKVADRLGRSATGTGALAVGWYLASQGKLNADRPTPGSGKADEFDLEGKTANSVLIGGKWRSLNRFSPVGNLLTLGAHLYNASQADDATPGSVAMAGLTGVGKTVEDQSFLRGASDLIDAAKGAPGAPERYLEGLAGSVVPAAIARVAGAVDPVVREQHGVADALKARIPGLSRSLEPKVNQLGEDVVREGGAAGAFLDPTAARGDRRQADPLVAELARVDARVTKLKREGGEAPGAFTNRQRVYGQALDNVLRQVLETKEYQEIPQLAAQMVETDPELAGRDPKMLARQLQKQHLEDAVRTLRRYLTYDRKHPELVDAGTP